MQLGRYKIIGSAKDQKIRNEAYNNNKTLYARDPEAYYPYVNSDNEGQSEPVVQTRSNRPNVYDLDKKAYYNPTGVVYKGPLPNLGKAIPVVLADLEDTFPTERNLNKLRMKLQAILTRENLSMSDVFEKGIYNKDPSAYYDTSLEDTVSGIKSLKDKIVVMEQQLNDNLRNNLHADIQTTKIEQKIQNQVNHDSEIKNKVIKENYLNPIGERNGYTKEFNVGTKLASRSSNKPKTTVLTEKEEVDVVTHDYQDAQSVAEINANNSSANQSTESTESTESDTASSTETSDSSSSSDEGESASSTDSETSNDTNNTNTNTNTASTNTRKNTKLANNAAMKKTDNKTSNLRQQSKK